MTQGQRGKAGDDEKRANERKRKRENRRNESTTGRDHALAEKIAERGIPQGTG